MQTCAFFGHSSCSNSIQPILQREIEKLILNHGITDFLLGDHGDFDVLVLKTIREIEKIYPIKYRVVLSYLPIAPSFFGEDPNSVYPEEIATVHPKFAIEYRNNFLISKSDYFITYVTHSYGGAAKFAKKAQNKGKIVINIADMR